mmetsp:Transcript_14160/g.34512  ORF Transcript_14160/g.34512 Transcript_14160/m.34512 type:complete len:536 (-) Transcript_14160:277-1884(-)|eukprot:CAMPEP_0114507628 /NCGR_PEP_ID=MMETSP0109-20121206/12122_1 /TAXON_ID=29199 /ORGANISM="Chlorarachnion reptans, Strain CCCM449" /LENGTH=535 /DNA_ID=CAMNT_0001686415 /DNA_START=250 /DNA_END=1857 /DNA_ORIENTATION=+
MSESKQAGYQNVAKDELESGMVAQGDNFWTPFFYSVLAAFGAFMFGYTLGFTSPALPAMYGDNSQNIFTPQNCIDSSVSSDMGSLFSAVVNLGAVGGSIIAGPIADTFGRRVALATCAIPLIIGWVWLAVTREVGEAIVARAISGIGVGIASMVVPTYITEISPDAYRGALVALNQLFITIGIFGVYLIGFALPHEDTTYDGCSDANTSTVGTSWPILAWVGAGLSGFLLLAAFIMPESPPYLIRIGEQAKAAGIMKRLWGANYNTDKYIRMSQDFKRDSEDHEIEPAEAGEKASLRDLLKPDVRMAMILGCGSMILQQWSGNNAVIFFCSTIFKSAGLSNTDQASLYVMGVQVLATGLSVYLMDRAGRRLLLLTASAGMASAAGTLGLLFLLSHSGSSTPGWLDIILVILYIVFFSIGMGPIPWLLMSELFPDYTRALAGSVATMINWFSAFGVTYSFANMEQSLKDYGTFWFYTCVLILGWFFMYALLPETKGLSSHEIQVALNRNKFFGYKGAESKRHDSTDTEPMIYPNER